MVQNVTIYGAVGWDVNLKSTDRLLATYEGAVGQGWVEYDVKGYEK
jgi:hypothetical protein